MSADMVDRTYARRRGRSPSYTGRF